MPMSLSHIQLASTPVRNEAVTSRVIAEGGLRLSLPLEYGQWSKTAGLLLPLSKERNVELDRLGAEILAVCDGEHTVEQIIDAHKARWKLPFCESRAMILTFLQHLVRHNFISIVVPPKESGSEGS